nr:hypothetical protein BaRGS_025151 [Batillaria attramentaria]
MRGHNKLFDNEGYSYAFKHKMKDGAIKWRCTIRNKTYRSCRASVLQRGSHFEQYSGPHIHPAKEGEEVANIISQKLRQAVERQPHKASSVLITEVLEEFLQGMPCPTLPSLNSLSRVIRYHRSRILEKSSGVDITNPDMKGYRMIGSQTPTVGKEVMEALARELQEDGAVALEEVESEVVESEVVESEVVESEVVF